MRLSISARRFSEAFQRIRLGNKQTLLTAPLILIPLKTDGLFSFPRKMKRKNMLTHRFAVVPLTYSEML